MKFLKQNIIQLEILVVMLMMASCMSANKEAYDYNSDLSIEQESVIEELQEFEPEELSSHLLSQIELQNFEELAMKKINDFEDLINILGQKQVEKTFRNHAAAQLVEMFENEDVEICSGFQNIDIRVPVKDLEKIIDQTGFSKLYLKIDSINIKQSWKRINDSTYFGLAQFNQEYTGIRKKDTIYHKISKLNMDIKLVQVFKKFGNELVPTWEVKLGKIDLMKEK